MPRCVGSEPFYDLGGLDTIQTVLIPAINGECQQDARDEHEQFQQECAVVSLADRARYAFYDVCLTLNPVGSKEPVAVTACLG